MTVTDLSVLLGPSGVVTAGGDECWIWPGGRFAVGYGSYKRRAAEKCRHGKLYTEHCNECEIAGYCGCPDCTEDA
jgi:hypothetical protein